MIPALPLLTRDHHLADRATATEDAVSLEDGSGSTVRPYGSRLSGQRKHQLGAPTKSWFLAPPWPLPRPLSWSLFKNR